MYSDKDMGQAYKELNDKPPLTRKDNTLELAYAITQDLKHYLQIRDKHIGNIGEIVNFLILKIAKIENKIIEIEGETK